MASSSSSSSARKRRRDEEEDTGNIIPERVKSKPVWGKLISADPQADVLLKVDIFKIGSDPLLNLVLSSMSTLLCTIRNIEFKSGETTTILQVIGKDGTVKVNGHVRTPNSTVILKSGDYMQFGKESYVFHRYKYENLFFDINVPSIEVSFESFPYYLSENTKNLLVTSTYVNLKCPRFVKYTMKLTASRILLSGPLGSEIYKETLAKALAKHYNAKLIEVHCMLLSRSRKCRKSGIVSLQHPLPLSYTPAEEYEMDEIMKIASNESKTGPLILFMKDVEKTIVGDANYYHYFQYESESLPENIVVIASHTQSEVQQENVGSAKKLDLLFPIKVTIEGPQDGALLSYWNQQLVGDLGTLKSQKNISSIRSVLNQTRIGCSDLEMLCIKDLVLTSENVKQVIIWAVSHHLMNNSDISDEESKLLISSKSIRFGLDMLQQSKPNSMKKALENVVTENEFEKRLLQDVIPSSKTGVSFDDIGANENVKYTLKELLMLPLQRPELFNKGQLTTPCKGILLFGPPGTGKTMLAKAVAAEAGANFVNISTSTIGSKYFGDGVNYVKAIFSLASKIAPSVVFVDEVDSLLGRCENPSEHEVMRRIKNEFMLNWDGLLKKDKERVVVLAATNRPFDLDEAVLRRFPRRLMVNLPDVRNREKILRVILAREELNPNVHIEKVAKLTEGYSGSDLKNLCVTAAHCPIREILEREKQEKVLALAKNRPLPSLYSSEHLRPLDMQDLDYARGQVCASVSLDSASVKELIQWNEMYGEGGSRKKEFLTYIT